MYADIRQQYLIEMRTFEYVAPTVLAATGWVVAQISGLDPNIANLIGNGVTVAVLAFYVVYDVRVRTPNMLSAFAKEQDDIRKAFKEEQAGSRETFAQTLEIIRSTFHAEQLAVRQENRDDRQIIRTQHAAEIDHWRKMVNENMQAMRVAVHDMKDTASLAVSKTELAARQALEDK